MKVKMLTNSAGPNGAIRAGQIIDVGEREAKLLIAGKYAEAMQEVPKEVVMEQPAVEEAVQEAPKPRKRK